MEYYIKATQAEAQASIDQINASGWFPIVGNIAGVPAPHKQQTTQWAEEPVELKTGEWGVPKVPAELLDHINIEQSERDAKLATHEQTVRTVQKADVVLPAPDIESFGASFR